MEATLDLPFWERLYQSSLFSFFFLTLRFLCLRGFVVFGVRVVYGFVCVCRVHQPMWALHVREYVLAGLQCPKVSPRAGFEPATLLGEGKRLNRLSHRGGVNRS